MESNVRAILRVWEVFDCFSLDQSSAQRITTFTKYFIHVKGHSSGNLKVNSIRACNKRFCALKAISWPWFQILPNYFMVRIFCNKINSHFVVFADFSFYEDQKQPKTKIKSERVAYEWKGGNGPKDVKFLLGIPTDSMQNIHKFLYSEAGCSREVLAWAKLISFPIQFGLLEQAIFALPSDLKFAFLSGL